MRGASTLWIMLLTLASTVTTLLLACATPFTALAALAATQMRLRDGIALTLAAWGASQAVGFCVLGYPRDATTLVWAATLAIAAVAATVAAHRLDRPDRGMIVRLALGYLVAVVAFKAVILVASVALGGVDIALSPAINARQFARNAAILAGLYALYCGLRSLGMPPAPQPVPAC